MFAESVDDCLVNLTGGCLCPLWGSKSRFSPVDLGRGSMPTSSPHPHQEADLVLLWSWRLLTRHQNKTGLKVFLNPNDTFRWGIYLIYYLQRKYFLISFSFVVYETMFAKRENWQGLERSELLKYFNDCGHFPTHQQIDEVWDLVHRGKSFSFLFLLVSPSFFLSSLFSSLDLSYIPSLIFF